MTRAQAADAVELATLIRDASREPDPVAGAVLDVFSGERAHVPLDYHSANPLVSCLDPVTRAVVVLLCRSRESPEVVDHALHRLPSDPQTILRRAQHAIAPAPLPPAYPNHLRIHRALPDPALRLPLALRASGLFDPADSIADLLRIHRATLYRRLDHAMCILHALHAMRKT